MRKMLYYGYGFLANCCFYAGCFLSRINSVLLWVMKKIYGASEKLLYEAIRLFYKGEIYKGE